MRVTLAWMAWGICLAFIPTVQGQAGAGSGRSGQEQETGGGRVAAQVAPDESGPVAVPEPGESARRFYRSGNALWCVRRAWEILAPGLLLWTGWSARARSRAERIGGKWYWAVTIYGLGFMSVLYALELPLDWYQGYVRLHEYGLSNQSFGRWLGHSLLGFLIDALGCAVLLWIPYGLIRWSPRRWWLHAWLASTAVAVFLVFISPVWIDPLFNRFGRMTDKALEADIVGLASRAGIDGSRVYVVDKSADSTALNAYVTGFLGTKRIVVWDTLLNRLDRREVLTVIGHEVGHYALGHVVKGVLAGSLLGLLALWLLHRIGDAWIRRLGRRWGVAGLSDVAALPLVLVLGSMGQLVVDPLVLAASRHFEHEADRFALEITHDNRAFATAEVKMAGDNLQVVRPGGWYGWWRASHPSTADRIEFANRYRPWSEGGAGRYDRLFDPARP